MRRITLFCILSVLVGFMTSCDNGHEVTNKLDYIKEVGNRNPKEALLMLDSVKAAQGGLSVAGGCRCLTKELDMIAC